MTGLADRKKKWQHNCNSIHTMKNYNYQPISDAYQLVQGAKIKGKNQEEIFELGGYDANKRGYTLIPIDDGVKFEDFNVLISEGELMNNYLIENVKVMAPAKFARVAA